MSDALPLGEYVPGHVHPLKSVKKSDGGLRDVTPLEDVHLVLDARD